MHATEIEMLQYIEDKLPAAARLKLEAHMGRCDDCAHQFATVVRLPHVLKEEIPIDVNAATFKKAAAIVAPRESTGKWRFRLFPSPVRVSLATLSVIGVVVATYFLLSPQQPSQFRSPETSGTTFIMYPEDGAVVNETNPDFHWNAIAQSSVYKFSLMDESGVGVWNWDVRDTMVTIPASVVLIPGKTYLWRVESFIADKESERSSLHAFTYAPSQ